MGILPAKYVRVERGPKAALSLVKPDVRIYRIRLSWKLSS
jgi:hypothetical protein